MEYNDRCVHSKISRFGFGEQCMMILLTFHCGFAQTNIKNVPHSLCTQLTIGRKEEMTQKYTRERSTGILKFISDNVSK